MIMLLKRLRKGDFIRLRQENPLSQSAVEAGMSSAMRFGNSVLKVSSSTTVDMT